MNYYTYAYLREDGTPYYIGKGKAGRITNSLHRISIPKDKNRIIYLKTNLTDEEARKHEIYMIAILGRKDLDTGILRNMTNGGEGCAGRRLSTETKRKISNKHKGRPKSEEHRRKLSEAAKKKIFTKKHRDNISKSLTGIMAKEKNPSYGKKWWNNGIDCKFSKCCPGQNYIRGRLINKR